MDFEGKIAKKIEEPLSKEEALTGVVESKPKESREIIDFQKEKEKRQEYTEVIKLKDELYDKITRERPETEGMRSNLEIHEKIVQQYGNELVEAHPDLSPEQKVTANLAVILHDCGKLESPLLEHHQKGAENAEKLLNQLKEQGKKIGNVEINEGIIGKVKEAIERHMNHPFLIGLKGERFPEPKDDIDKIVFNADMMANVGFKNIGFRLINKDFMIEDAKAAKEASQTENRKVNTLEASFINVIEDVRKLDEVVLTDPAKEKTGELIEKTEAIFDYFKENNIFEKVQNEFSDKQGNFNIAVMKEKFGKDWLKVIKKRLNEEIEKAGLKLNIDRKILNNFQM